MPPLIVVPRDNHGAGVPAVSSEISDLCEIADLFLFVSYFISQSK